MCRNTLRSYFFYIVFIFFPLISFDCIQDGFNLQQVEIRSDVQLDKDEIVYLTGLVPGVFVTKKMLEAAVFYLQQKNRYKKATFQFIDCHNGKKIVLYLQHKWRFAGIKIRGIFRGKDAFYAKYIQELGEPFDDVKHALSLQSIKDHLFRLGYFNADIKSQKFYDSTKKEIRIKIVVHKNRKFRIVDSYFDAAFSLPEDLAIAWHQELMYKKFDVLRVFSVLNRLRLYVKNKGFLRADVTADVVCNKKNATIYLDYKVNLGRQYQFAFVGNTFVPAAYLQETIVENYLDLPYDLIADQIKLFYVAKGFLDAHAYGNEETHTFYIQEGRRHTITDIVLSQADTLTQKDVLDAIAQEYSGSFADEDAIRKVEHQIKDAYHDRGFMSAQCRCTLKNQGTQCLLYIEVTEGIQGEQDQKNLLNQVSLDQRFGKLVIHSNVRLPFKRFLREFDIEEGELCDIKKLDSSFYALRDLDLFTSFRMFIAPTTDVFGSRPVIIKAINDSIFELRARLGFQQVSNIKLLDWRNRSTYKIGGSFLLRNPLHVGDKLKFDVDFTIFYRHIVAQYTLPFLFDRSIRTNFRIYGNKFFQPIFNGSHDNIYRISQNGGLMSLSYKPIKKLVLSSAFGDEYLKITGLSFGVARAIKFSDFLVDKKINYFFVEPTVFYEDVDAKINPTCGISFLASARAQCATRYTKVSYIRLLVESSGFYPIGKNIVLAGRVRFGTLFCDNFEYILPSERFYLGGSNSLRSYNPDFAPPLAALECNPTIKLVPVGGSCMVNANVELRIAVFKALGFVVFQDIGYLTNPFYTEHNILTATGFGLRYSTPIGPIRFDIGFKPKNNLDKKAFAWFLTVGQAF